MTQKIVTLSQGRFSFTRYTYWTASHLFTYFNNGTVRQASTTYTQREISQLQ